MSRTPDSWWTLACSLARVLATDAPAWVAADTRRAARTLLARLRRDAQAVLEREGPDAAARTIGAGRGTLYEARAAGGWLGGE